MIYFHKGTMIDNINVVKSSSSGSSSSNDGATTKKTAGTFLPKKKDTPEINILDQTV